MISGLPAHTIIILGLALAVAGFAMGWLAGLLGIGGGGIIVPVLYEIFGATGVDESIRMQMCVATSLAIIVPTSVRSFQSHTRLGGVDLAVLRRLGPWVGLGVIAGVFIGSHAPASVLKAAFVASSVFMAARLILSPGRAGSTARLPGRPFDQLAGTAIGIISTLIGIGGGVYISGYMSWFGWPIHKAVGTAAGFGPIIAIPAVIGYMASGWGSTLVPAFSLGFVSPIAAAVVAPISFLSAPAGAKMAHRLPRRALELIFAAFLLAVAFRFTLGLIL